MKTADINITDSGQPVEHRSEEIPLVKVDKREFDVNGPHFTFNTDQGTPYEPKSLFINGEEWIPKDPGPAGHFNPPSSDQESQKRLLGELLFLRDKSGLAKAFEHFTITRIK